MLQMYPASHSYFMSTDKPTVVLKHFFWNYLGEVCLTHWDICLQSFVAVLMSKFRMLKSPKRQLLRLYRVSPLWRQGFNRDKQMYISCQVKTQKGKDHGCAIRTAIRKLRKARIMAVIHSCQMCPYWTHLIRKTQKGKDSNKKTQKGKDHGCDSFMSDVSVLDMFHVAQLHKWNIYLLNSNASIRFFRWQTLEWENDEPRE